MAVKMGPFSCVATSLSSPFQYRRISKISIAGGLLRREQFGAEQLRNPKVKIGQFKHGILKVNDRVSKRRCIDFSTSEEWFPSSELDPDVYDQENDDSVAESISEYMSSDVSSPVRYGTAGGRPGLLTFYSRPNQREEEVHISSPRRNQNGLLWFVGPTVLVASFVFPSLYLRRILSAVFEDSLLTDFLILFFTEALFYCGVAAFLLLVDHLRRPVVPVSATYNRNLNPQLGHQISSVAVLVLSIIVPMVTMGFVWPWTGPAASATLAPYLVGIVVQFAFEQYARYIKSPSWPVIPIIFKVYRLHQLNRAAQLVTALSFTVRGAEMTPHNLAINSSLGTLLNVLQFLGVICIWSLSSFLMRFFPSATILEQ
ncbi:uncharacterized protein LOC131311329 isoform X2 [Rhododendron vialii]|uniref:uncharacterized protein LOC131311329 isoform X2 n=1 Tax=Rhododendron vialii TaxID=182163 RepID=UPI00265DB71E|nr:uncharacterized protein LOC131311329 isoform X2 [Rhododendron vialii]